MHGGKMRKILNGKVLIATLVFASVLLCASFTYIMVKRPAAAPADLTPASAALTIIPAPTSTPRPLPATTTPLPFAAMSSPSPAPGQIGIGVYVQVATGGDTLHIRAEPGLGNEPLFMAFDSEVFLVTKGPQQADGYTWWYLTASYDASRAGWAAQDFLTVIPSP
jgi:hypothetical protein